MAMVARTAFFGFACITWMVSPGRLSAADDLQYPPDTVGEVRIDQAGLCECDLVRDGIIDFYDFALLASHWWDHDCIADNNWCDGADINQSQSVDFNDLRVMTVLCWLDEDTEAPTPDPMQWDLNVNESGFDGRPREVWIGPDPVWDWGATMRADPNAFDETGLEFFFKCVSDGRYSSGWISFPDGPPYVYTVIIGKGFGYIFQVQARDQSINNSINITGWSPPDVAD